VVDDIAVAEEVPTAFDFAMVLVHGPFENV